MTTAITKKKQTVRTLYHRVKARMDRNQYRLLTHLKYDQGLLSGLEKAVPVIERLAAKVLEGEEARRQLQEVRERLGCPAGVCLVEWVERLRFGGVVNPDSTNGE